VGQIYAEAESKTNLFALPRRNSINGRRPNMAEAESKTNLFALCRLPSASCSANCSADFLLIALTKQCGAPGIPAGHAFAVKTVKKQ